jgi:hypothetical protein
MGHCISRAIANGPAAACTVAQRSAQGGGYRHVQFLLTADRLRGGRPRERVAGKKGMCLLFIQHEVPEKNTDNIQ